MSFQWGPVSTYLWVESLLLPHCGSWSCARNHTLLLVVPWQFYTHLFGLLHLCSLEHAKIEIRHSFTACGVEGQEGREAEKTHSDEQTGCPTLTTIFNLLEGTKGKTIILGKDPACFKCPELRWMLCVFSFMSCWITLSFLGCLFFSDTWLSKLGILKSLVCE